MIMEFNKFFGGTYVDCIYTAEDRSVISATFKDTNEDLFEYHILANSEEPAYVELLKLVDIETIEQNTRNRIDEERKTLLALAQEEATNQGFIMVNEIEDLIINKVINFNPETDTEFLFKLKLKCFEMDIVSDCTDEDLRIDLRNAETIIDILNIVTQIKNIPSS